MSLPNISLIVIGHKDHGKSTLIGRLLYDSKAIHEKKLQEIKTELEVSGKKEFEFAYILDSLEEERKGGLTIDITQMPFKSRKYLYTIIDAPGHREFIKKMLTGASQADAAILVLSAKEGIEDQTKQHLFLVKTLGIKQFVIALNKMDVSSCQEETFLRLSEEIGKILTTLELGKQPVIPVSALNGDNVFSKSKHMDWYRGDTLIEALDKIVIPPYPPVDKPLRAIVQDVYNAPDKRIVVCKIVTGKVEAGDSVLFTPSNERGIVEKIESFGEEKKEGSSGDSLGLLVRDVYKIKRGNVISSIDHPAMLTEKFTAEIIVFSEVEIQSGGLLTIKLGTSEGKYLVKEILEKIDPINLVVQEKNPKILRNGDIGKVELKPLEDVSLEPFSEFPQLGRFVVIDRKGAYAAGIILEVKRRNSEKLNQTGG